MSLKEQYSPGGRRILTIANGVVFELYFGSALDLTGNILVNAANGEMRGGGGFDGMVHRLAGPKLLEALTIEAPFGAATAQPVITPACGLKNFSYICHVAAPRFDGEDQDIRNLSVRRLQRTYYACLSAANNSEFQSIVFPSLATGIFKFPLAEAATAAISSINLWALHHPANLHCLNEITLAAFTDAEQEAYNTVFDELVEEYSSTDSE